MAYSQYMCGITGVLTAKNSQKLPITELIKTMTDSISHRGPDDEAYYTTDHLALGMRRLAIVDLTKGLYPFISTDKQVVMVFNGEIYNYLQLKNELHTLGHEFKTNCDGEVIMEGFIEWGTGVFSHLRGMFAICIWDNKRKRMILARDRFGIKPLYYLHTSQLFAFGSEAKALYKLRDLHDTQIDALLKLDSTLIQQLLGFMYLPESSKTIVSGVKKLEPGNFIEISQELEIKVIKYWQLIVKPQYENISYEQAQQLVEDKLVESIKMHLMSDVPLAVLLSGGLDSSLITAIMVKKLGVNVNTYTAKFNHAFNESELAKQTAQLLGTTHHEITIDTTEINTNIEKYIPIFDDLTTFDGGLITTAILSGEINKDGVKVLLLGEGADEVFGGYSWYGISQLPFRLMPDVLKSALYYYSISRNISHRLLQYALYWYSKTNIKDNTFNDISFRELFTQLPNHLLMKVDKGTMYKSLEARVPYLDHELVELVYSLSQNYKLAGTFFNSKKSNEKRILRDIAKKYLPDEICTRKKKGFLLPMNDVLQANSEKVKDCILNPNSISNSLLDPKFINGLFVNSSIPMINMQNEYFKWRLFILEYWAIYYNLKI